MTPTALVLVAAAATIHATWNLLAKRAGDRLAFLWLVNGAGLVIYLPAAAVILQRYPAAVGGWPYVLASGALHAAYYWCLSRMYQHDFSLTYPTARGSAPLLVALVSVAFLREPLTAWGLGGVGLIIVGMGALHLRYLPGQGLRWPLGAAVRGPAGRSALLTAAMIAAYSLVDRAGVRHINPIAYLWSVHLVSFAILGVCIMGRQRARAVAAARQSRWKILFAAVAQNLAYILVLFAMRLAPIAYVVPTREISTLIGALFGVVLLKEPFPLAKLAGASLILAGVALIAVRG